MKEKVNSRKKVSDAFIKAAIVSVVITIVAAALGYYILMPSLNPKSIKMYIIIAVLLLFVFAPCLRAFIGLFKGDYYDHGHTECKYTLIAAEVIGTLIVLFLIVMNIANSTVFNAKKYSNLMTVQDGNFATDIQEVEYSKIPMLDSDSAQRIGSRKLGELSDLVSQYELMESNNQINYNGHPVRLIGLKYANIFRWLNNHENGIPGYVIVDMVTQQADVVRVDGGIRYSTAEHFGNNLMRHVQFAYPCTMFGTPVFELDDNGNPYWICPIVDNTIGLFGGTDVIGAVIVDAISGDMTRYSLEEVPTWVDRLYPASMLIDQYDSYGRLSGGFWNSLFSQIGVTETTEGYNYVVIDDDVYLYTGVTSTTSDESNIGFLLVNQRTKETKFYSVSGATEYSAMSSAESQVQQMDYTATFPILLNIEDQPTYFMSLKGYDGLVKLYAMVNVESYQIVETGKTVAECEANYKKALVNNGIVDDVSTQEESEDEAIEYISKAGIIDDIRSAVVDGNTYYYIRLSEGEVYYAIKADVNSDVIIMNVGDNVEVIFENTQGSIVDAKSIKRN